MSAELFNSWQDSGCNTHWLTPIKAKARYDIVEKYTEHDLLIEMPLDTQVGMPLALKRVALVF